MLGLSSLQLTNEIKLLKKKNVIHGEDFLSLSATDQAENAALKGTLFLHNSYTLPKERSTIMGDKDVIE